MKAMEEQIASLAGLVQHALAVGPNVAELKDIARCVCSLHIAY